MAALMAGDSEQRRAISLYKCGAAAFGLLSVSGLLALPYALRCCSGFEPDEVAFRQAVGWATSGPAIRTALLDWPMGFRLFLMAVVASVICASAMIGLAFTARWEARTNATAFGIQVGYGLRVLLSSIVVGVLYLLCFYTVGFFGIGGGPHNLSWAIGIPVVVAWLGKPGAFGCALGLPLAFTGFVCLLLICLVFQIPLD
jgi:hypothetical protein